MRFIHCPVIVLVALLLPCGGAHGESQGPLGPAALVLSGDGETLYVANADARQIAVVDVAGRRVVTSVDVPARPSGLALSPAGRVLFVTCAAPCSRVLAIDTRTTATLWTCPAGHTATAPAVTPDGRWLFVCNRFDNDVSLIDAATGRQVTRVAVTREPIAAAVAPDGRTLVVANHLPLSPATALLVCGVVTLIDTVSLKTTTVELPDGSTSLRDVCVTPDSRYALVTHVLGNYDLVASHLDQGWMNTNALSVVDLSARRLVGNVLLDDLYQGAANAWAVAVTHDAATVCVTHAGTHEMSILEAGPVLAGVLRVRESRGPMGDPNAVTGCRRRLRLPGSGPRDVAIAGGTAYVAEYFSDTVAVVPLQPAPPGRPASIRLGPVPNPSRVRRGEMLFHDATYCFEQWQSCATCHPDGRADGLNWDLFNDGFGNPKNTKSMLLAHQTPPAMISAVRPTAEVAVRAGMEHILFAEAREDAAVAIDAYLKSLRPVASPRLAGGRLSPSARRGRLLFESRPVGCATCHPAPLYTDLKRHRVSPPGTHEHRSYDTPTLVETWRTAPYLHDGRFTTVKGLLVDGRHGSSRGGVGQLSDRQVEDLVEFVRSL